MRTIQTTYSLEPFISRLPSVYPSYNGSDELLCFDKDSIDKRDGRYTSNYGMVPINVPFKLLNTINQNHDYEFDDKSYICEHPKWYISWSTFSEWFSFFKNYYRILNDCGSCGRVYSSATDFYDYEYKSSSSRNLPLGNDRESYEEYDKLFAKRGGKLNSTTNNCDDNSKGTIVKYSDIGLFKLINDYIVPSFEIPHEFTNYWNTDKIYYPNVIRWISWLDIRKDYPTELDKCSERHDCCDCEEYIQRGGSSLLESLKTWYKATNSKVELINKLIKDNINNETWHFKPYIVKEISILNTFEKSSQQSILSEVYDTNIDFRGVKSYSDNVNNNSGTTVVVEEKSMLLTANSSGNKFDEKYMEKVYDNDAFTEYYDIYINGNGKDFTSDYPWYGVNSNNVKKYGKTADEVKDLFCDRLDIERNGTYGWFLIDNDLTEVVPIETISMKDGINIPVFREEGTNTPYVTIGGSDIYATYNFKMNKYYFSFNKDVGFDRNKLSESDYCYIRYNSNITIIKSSDKKVTYTLSNGDKISYGRVDGYSYDTNGDILYVVGNDVCTSFSIDNDGNVSYVKKDKASIEGDIIIIRHDDDIETSLCDFISGTTSSKLLELRVPNIMTDDNGNMIHAMNITGSTDRPKGIYAQPNIGEELEPLYQVGNVSSISPFKLTYENYNNDDKKLTFIGNIISKMEFYYTDGDNKKIDVQVDVKKNDDGTYEQKPSVYITSIEKGELKSSLEAIKKTRDVIEIYKRNFPVNVVSDNIHCDVTYHIGATLNRIGNDYFIADEYNSGSGVTYTESVEFVKNKEEYYLGSDKVSYPVYVYEMLQNDSYIATFMAQINTYSSTTEESKIESSYSKMDDMDSHNGLDVYPTYQEAYNIGVVSSPIIDSNVNIYRGNNAAFEKHLKFGEVTSLEALENYTNGYFNMIET